MRQKKLLNLLLLFTIITTSSAQVASFSVANKTETDDFIAAIGSNGFESTGTISSFQWGGAYGVKIAKNATLTFPETNLAAGDYIMEAVIMIQNIANHSWIQDVWATGGTVPTALIQTGTSGSYVTYSETVTVPSTGDYTFGIVRGNAGNGSFLVKSWSITSASAGPNTETDITAFTLPQQTGDATIDAGAHTVAIEVAYGTNITSLTPTVEISSDAIVSPLSGAAQDFSSPVTYTVTAEDGVTVQDWTITVTEAAASTETDITTFYLADQTGDATIDAGAHTVSIEVLYGTTLTSLTPTVALSAGASVSPNSGTAQDFSGPVTYSVTAEDGSTMEDWTVTVTTAVASSETDITAFTLTEQTGAATIDAGAHTVAIEVVNGSTLTSLTPTIELSTGATISPLSGVAQDFSSVVSYTVTAQDGSTMQSWDITVTEGAAVSGGPMLNQNFDSDYISEQSWPANKVIYTSGSPVDAGVVDPGTFPDYYGYVAPTYANGRTTPMWVLQGYLTMGAPNNAAATGGEDTWFTYTVSGLTIGENYKMMATITPTGAWAGISYTLAGWTGNSPANGYVVSNELVNDPVNDVDVLLAKTLHATAETMTIGIGAGKASNYFHKTRIISWSIEQGVVTEVENNEVSNKVYPNPANNFININGLASGVMNVSVVDITGKSVQKSVLNGRVDISDLKSGIYFIKLPGNSLRFIKE